MSVCNISQLLTHIFPTVQVQVLYAVVVIGVYRSNAVNDWARLFIAVVVHPLAQEAAVTYQRDQRTLWSFVLLSGKDRSHLPLASMHISSLIESYFIFLRRFMIGEDRVLGERVRKGLFRLALLPLCAKYLLCYTN